MWDMMRMLYTKESVMGVRAKEKTYALIMAYTTSST